MASFFGSCTNEDFAQDTATEGVFFKNNQEILGVWYLKECRCGNKDGYKVVPSKLQSVEFTNTMMTLQYSEKTKEYCEEMDGSLTELSESTAFSGEYNIPVYSGDGPKAIILGQKTDGVWPAVSNGVECVFRGYGGETTWAFSSMVGRDNSGNLTWIRLDGVGNDTNQYLYYFEKK